MEAAESRREAEEVTHLSIPLGVTVGPLRGVLTGSFQALPNRHVTWLLFYRFKVFLFSFLLPSLCSVSSSPLPILQTISDWLI